VLFSPEFHEPLTARGWDEAWVNEQIERIADDALAAVGDDGLWPMHPSDYDQGEEDFVRHGLYMGAAGMDWGLRALDHEPPDRDVYAHYLAEPDWPGVVPGYLMGESGILLAARQIDDRLHDAILRNVGNPTNELMWGAPGTMLAALRAHEATGEARWADAWRASADELWARWQPDDLWTQDMYEKTALYIGPAHGFAGNVRSLWLGRELLDDARAAELERRAIEATTAFAYREDGLANWAPNPGPLAHRGRIRVQWCHGAPGMVTSLASMGRDDEAFGALLRDGGELTWRAGPLATGLGLCHGTAGNALAFLALLERTGEERWLDRARRFAVHALEQVQRERVRHGFGRFTLWTGDLGAAVVAKSCLEGRPGVPSLDWL
jgi:hypothetical protein